MKFSDYMNDKKSILLLCFAGGLFFSALLFLFGVGAAELLLLWICYVGIVSGAVLYDFFKRKKRMGYLRSVFDSLDRKYLFAEVTDAPESVLEQAYFRILQKALKNMTDEVALSRRQNEEYRDFVEQWIHEIKAPITGIELLCENNKTDTTRKIMTQTELIEQNVEKVLFYARLGSVEKDYLIKEITLRDCVMETLGRNKQFLIQNGVSVHTEAVSDTVKVYSDKKWLGFILNQILINSVKYRSEKPPIITFKAEVMESGVMLSITDNGIGIRQSEISRIFDKGFVGSNGRNGKKATGIGLYLCRQLCDRLGMEIAAESELNQYTAIRLYFPENDFLRV